MEQKTAAAAIVDCLRAEGIKKVFGLPGSQILPLVDEFFRSQDLEFVTTRHEHGASYAAFGYAAATGGPAACISTLGPGATNLLSGIAAAYKAALPVIAFTGKGGFKVHQKDAFQEIDEVSIFRPVTKWSYMINNAEEVPSILQKAFRLALTGRPGPVHISIPAGTILPKKVSYEPFIPRQYRPLHNQPFAQFIPGFAGELAAVLSNASNPVILAGDEVKWEKAEESLRQFAEMVNIPVVTALHFADIMKSTHPLFMGNVSADGWDCANKVLQSADVVLAMGVHLDFLTTKFSSGFFPAGAKVIHVSNYPERIGAVYKMESGIISTVSAFLQSAIQLVREKGIKRGTPTNLAELKSAWLNQRNEWGNLHNIPLKPQFVAYTLCKSLPKGAALVGDGGNFFKFVRACSESEEPRTFFVAENFGSVGSGFPIALGVKAADPSRPVAAALGDGGMMLGGAPDFETAVRSKLPFVSVIFNDCGFANIRAYQKRDYGERYTCNFGIQDFAGMAKIHGGFGVRVEKPEQLEPAIREAFTKNVPSLIDVAIDPMELAGSVF